MPKSRGRTKKASKKTIRRAARPAGDEPSLLGGIRLALSDPHPLSMLMNVSMLMFVTDTRRNHPFAAPEDTAPMPRAELFGTFIEVREPETTALLAVAAEMIRHDDVLRARMRRELAARPPSGPAWLTELGQTQTYRAVQMSHVLGDGDNIILGTRLPGGHELTCSVYIDHNVGTLVKDAMVIPEPISAVVAKYQEVSDDPDTRWDDIPLADAKARITAAIELSAITFPPFESDDWPASRALVEWLISDLPEGGTNYQRPEWDSRSLERLRNRFALSEFGEVLNQKDKRDLLESLFWYGTDYGNGDPTRWSAVKVEILLTDWLPRKVMAPEDYLSQAPELLRAFIRFVHAESGIRDELTTETLLAIDAYEPQYQNAIRSHRPQGVDAVLQSLGIDLDGGGDGGVGQILLANLARDAGGYNVLEVLDDNPLPNEPFRWEGIAEDIEPRVDEVLTLVDRCCEELLDIEYRTACRRLLTRVAVGDADLFRRKGKSETAAAAIVWLIGKVNHLFGGQPGRRLQVNELMSHFGVKGSASQRAETFLRAGGFEASTTHFVLGIEFLTSTRRHSMIEIRDRYQ